MVEGIATLHWACPHVVFDHADQHGSKRAGKGTVGTYLPRVRQELQVCTQPCHVFFALGQPCDGSLGGMSNSVLKLGELFHGLDLCLALCVAINTLSHLL
jgi:hypothetical protein